MLLRQWGKQSKWAGIISKWVALRKSKAHREEIRLFFGGKILKEFPNDISYPDDPGDKVAIENDSGKKEDM